ncbi:hypothetical protein PAHAL_7G240100 [Panicum hallii]|uniref:DUF3598 domain-containing protein n=1 Tax=Panicum hallii TaxID=206008 RepID=A0A2S3I8Z7_9POAL|nr:uncharacterized protein LOC112899723 [Panicum hallii]PAN39406.1 hypothetical protein PAHAL_7G240100 [Panicum hallii]
MQPPCLGACGGGGLALPVPRRRVSSSSSRGVAPPRASVSCSAGGGKASPRGKENVWSVDNERAAKDAGRGPKHRRRRRPGGRRLPPPPPRRKGNDADSRVLVSGAMLVEVETVLQTQEPVIKPSWDTFASSLSGNWKGVGAVFSPITAEMEPVGVGSKEEYLYDCYTLSHIEKCFDSGHGSEIRRRTNWVPINPFGEAVKQIASYGGGSYDASSGKGTADLPSYESFDLNRSAVLDEETFAMEPGIVFFEDGSYSRGPVDIAIGEYDESKYFLSPTYKFEQCLVKGCHNRLRIVHTIEFNEGGANIQIVRVAVYEEKWASPANIHVEDDTLVELKPFSQRSRTKPSELTGSWKVYEVSATPIFSDEMQELEGGSPFVYLCMETVKKRTLPESSVVFGEEEILDMQDVTVLWLPGGVTAYVDINEDGVLCIGVGWYSEEGINLVMERDYGTDGRLREVRMKTEVKRRWYQSVP